jgi:4-hydroxythreonine-4-phosphate dehydrogenase
MKVLAITTGDPAGIGPEITVKALQFHVLRPEIAYVVYGRYPFINQGHKIKSISDISEVKSPGLYHIPIDDESVVPGFPSFTSGKIALEILKQVSEDLNSKKADAVLTAPISKSGIRHTDEEFIGHTEFFAKESNIKDVIMSFWGPTLNLSLLSTHISLSNISTYILPDLLRLKYKLIVEETRKLIPNAKFAMLGVNPHAGEEGAFGTEDMVISEVLEGLKETDNIIIDGPFPADTFFKSKYEHYDMVISAYHDQGLIPFKLLSFNRGVNVTLGLPYYRASVDHGTAFDIAGKQKADHTSMSAALEFLENRLTPALKQSSSYGVFAEFYDHYMQHVKYDDWVEFILSQFTHLKKRNPHHILEIACGTANIATRMKRKGLNVTACDLSEEMLSVAAGKQNKPDLYQADMLDPIDENKYDLILCLFDSINYLTDQNKVGIMLKHVEKGLMEGGIFIFDISTHLNSLDYFDDYLNVDENPSNVVIHRAYFDNNSWMQYNDLSLFVKNGNIFFRFQEKHEQRIYKTKEILEMVEKSGMKLLGVYGGLIPRNLKNHNPSKLDHYYTRIFFILQKPDIS